MRNSDKTREREINIHRLGEGDGKKRQRGKYKSIDRKRERQ